MATESQLKVVFAGLLCAMVGILGSALFFYQKHQEASRNFTRQADELRQQISALEQDRASLQQELVKITADKTALTDKLDALTTELESVNKQLSQAQTELQTTTTQLATTNTERTALHTQVDALTAERNQLKTQGARAAEEHTALTKTLKELQDRVTAVQEEKRVLATELEEVRERPTVASAGAAKMPSEAIELPPIVVYRGDPLTALDLPAGAVSARVIAVNQEQRFIIIDRGSGEGIFLGSVLQVYRNGQPIAKVKAVRVREELSACDLLPTDTGQAPNVGDLAVLVKE